MNQISDKLSIEDVEDEDFCLVQEVRPALPQADVLAPAEGPDEDDDLPF